MAKLKLTTKTIKLSELHVNRGQVAGLPKNPRFIRDERFEALKKSIEDDPEMLQLREVIAYDNSGELVIIAGNMRYRALKELAKVRPEDFNECIVKILPQDTPAAKLRAYTIKDNVAFGQNSFDDLANEWELEELLDFGLECDFLGSNDDEESEQQPLNLDAEKKEKPFVCKLTFATKEQLDAFKNTYEQQLKSEFEDIIISVSGGEL